MRLEPTVTVVIPAGSIDHLLETQIRAVIGQASPSTEVIVSMNTDDPGARALLDTLMAEIGDDRVRMVDSSATRSAAHARNVGAAHSLSDLLLFCDGDDIVADGWLESLLGALETSSAVGGRLVEFADSGDLPKWRPPATPDGLPAFLGVPYLVSANMAVTRSAFEGVGGFDESLTRCEDIAISWRLSRAGYQLAFAADAVVNYRVRGSIATMLRQHYLYGIGMSEVLLRDGRPGDDEGGGSRATLFRANNQKGGLQSPVAVLRKCAIASGRLVGLAKERRRKVRS